MCHPDHQEQETGVVITVSSRNKKLWTSPLITKLIPEKTFCNCKLVHAGSGSSWFLDMLQQEEGNISSCLRILKRGCYLKFDDVSNQHWLISICDTFGQIWTWLALIPFTLFVAFFSCLEYIGLIILQSYFFAWITLLKSCVWVTESI